MQASKVENKLRLVLIPARQKDRPVLLHRSDPAPLFKVHQIGFTDLETVGHAREWLIGIHASVSAGYLFFSASQSAPSLIYVPALPAQSPRACSSCRSVARKSSGAE